MQVRAGILDADAAFRKALCLTLEQLGRVGVEVVEPGTLAARRAELDVLFLDSEMSDAMLLVEECKRAHPELEIVLVTASPKMELAVKAMRVGASDYLTKPVASDRAAAAVDRARRVRRLFEENRRLKEQLRGSSGTIVGSTPAMRRLSALVEGARGAKAALVIGELGTERETIARALHGDGPFVKVDAAALGPEATGAELGERGRAVEKAEGGTLFVDEIALVPPAEQARLASSGARLIGATSRDLLEALGRGEFRMDLLRLLAATTLAIPPLRERKDDLPLLIDAILRRRTTEGKRAATSIATDAMETMQAYDWPQNVRELESAIERACELGGGDWVERRHLPPAVIQGAEAKQKTGSAEITKSLKEMESEIIRELLAEHKGDTDAVSRILKIDRSTLYRKIKRYGIDLGDLK